MSLCLRNVEDTTDEESLRNTFNKFDTISEVQISSNGKRRDAYILFNDTRQAIEAFEFAAKSTVHTKKRKGLVLDRT